MWYVVFVNLYLEHFIVFQQDTDPITGDPVVTSWKLHGAMAATADGTSVYDVSGKLRIHYYTTLSVANGA